jgi:hypothetical protein
MNDDTTLRDALDELVPAAHEDADWDDVLARGARLRKETDQRRPRSSSVRRPRSSFLLVGAAASVAVALVALATNAPWRGGPTIIDRAAAAIAVPSSGQILYESISVHVTLPLRRRGVPLRSLPPAAAARIERLLRAGPRTWTGHARLWIEGASPHRFRFTITGRWGHALLAMPPTGPTELGGALSGFDGLGYDTQTRTLYAVAFDVRPTQAALDPAAFVRAALAAGHARAEGTTTIRGRKAIRILVRAEVLGQLEPVGDYYVDARTYQPIRVVVSHGGYRGRGANLPGMPLTSLTVTEQATLPPIDGRYVFDFTDYRELDPTTANQKLTNISAMHSQAKTG